MKRNVEIKARLTDPAAMLAKVEGLATRGPEILEQVDRYFRGAWGRLKLRTFGDGGAELIWYRRPDSADPAESEYLLAPSEQPEALSAILAAALEPLAVLRKRRQVFHADETRIHLDEVVGLGSFLELEVVLAADQERDWGVRRARELMAALGIAVADLVEVGYLDLALANPQRRENARRFAVALDEEDYGKAREYMAENCRYAIGGQTLTGPEAILDSYRANGDWATRHLDEIRFESQVEPLPDGHFLVNYLDHLRSGDLRLTHRCQQVLRLDERAKVVGIEHRDLPGEPEALNAFFQAAGIKRQRDTSV